MRKQLLAALFLLLGVTEADAQTNLQVMGGGPMQGTGAPLVEAFSKQTAVPAIYIGGATRGTAVQDKLNSGAQIDVVIASEDDMKGLVAAGVIQSESVVVLARNSIGVGMRPGAMKPDLSTPEKFRAAMLAARSLALPDPKAGTPTSRHVTKIMSDLGITDQVAKKAIWVIGVTSTKVGSGEAELSIGSVPEVLVPKGAELAGPLPESLQLYTVLSAGIVAKSGRSPQSRAFIDFLVSEAAAPIWKTGGLEVLANARN